MITKIIMPKLGETMEEGTIGKWFRKEGDNVKKGEPLFEVTTDKANFEVESMTDGVLRKILFSTGDGNIPVLKTIGYIAGSMTEAIPAEAEPQPGLSPAGKPQDTIIQDGGLRASPAARRLAKEKNIDISLIKGTGPEGRITEKDVLSFEGAPASNEAGVEIIPMSAMRKVIAQRLVMSKRESPHYYVQDEVDMTGAVGLRGKILSGIENKHGVRVSFNDIIVKGAADTLSKFPMINATFERDNIISFKNVNIGIAISVEQGLVVPVIKGADLKTVVEIAKERARLGALAKENRLSPKDMEGGTFTVSNLGMFNVDSFNAIINPPQVAILAVGRIKKLPRVVDNQVVIRSIMNLNLSADHRVVDGAYAAQFMDELRKILENPDKIKIE